MENLTIFYQGKQHNLTFVDLSEYTTVAAAQSFVEEQLNLPAGELNGWELHFDEETGVASMTPAATFGGL